MKEAGRDGCGPPLDPQTTAPHPVTVAEKFAHFLIRSQSFFTFQATAVVPGLEQVPGVKNVSLPAQPANRIHDFFQAGMTVNDVAQVFSHETIMWKDFAARASVQHHEPVKVTVSRRAGGPAHLSISRMNRMSLALIEMYRLKRFRIIPAVDGSQVVKLACTPQNLLAMPLFERFPAVGLSVEIHANNVPDMLETLDSLPELVLSFAGMFGRKLTIFDLLV